MKTDLFQSCGHYWVFQICWHIEINTFTTSSFRIWNRSAGIPSPPLTLFIVMLPKAHLTSYSRMSGSRWVITPSWLSGPLLSCTFWLFDYLIAKSIYYLAIVSEVRNPESIQILHWLSDILFLIWYENGMQIITKTKVKNEKHKSSLGRSRLLTFPNRLRGA